MTRSQTWRPSSGMAFTVTERVLPKKRRLVMSPLPCDVPTVAQYPTTPETGPHEKVTLGVLSVEPGAGVKFETEPEPEMVPPVVVVPPVPVVLAPTDVSKEKSCANALPVASI